VCTDVQCGIEHVFNASNCVTLNRSVHIYILYLYRTSSLDPCTRDTIDNLFSSFICVCVYIFENKLMPSGGHVATTEPLRTSRDINKNVLYNIRLYSYTGAIVIRFRKSNSQATTLFRCRRGGVK